MCWGTAWADEMVDKESKIETLYLNFKDFKSSAKNYLTIYREVCKIRNKHRSREDKNM